MNKEIITILGATGSIGTAALKIIAARPHRYEVFALTAAVNREALLGLCRQFHPRYAVIAAAADALWIQEQLKTAAAKLPPTEVLYGAAALEQVAAAPEVDTVLAAIVGAAGAAPTFAAAATGKKILLANKETLVLGGAVFGRLKDNSGAVVLPVDSEHNAVFQILPADKSTVQNIVLTASGGPFLHFTPAQLRNVSVTAALKHPRWQMGKKISIDSATMMNKALEIIEAYWLFGLDPGQIEALIHPESVIHGMVRFTDGTVKAVLGAADMALPIGFCLAYPERLNTSPPPLDFTEIQALHFYAADTEKFPALKLAYEVLAAGGDAGCVLNAANEVAVSLFLAEKIAYVDIVNLNREVLAAAALEEPGELAALLQKDREIRILTGEMARKFYR